MAKHSKHSEHPEHLYTQENTWEFNGHCYFEPFELAIGLEVHKRTLMFVPSGFQPGVDMDLIVFLHGITSARNMSTYIKDADKRGILSNIAYTGKNVILAAPYLGHNPQGCRIGKLDDFVDQILKAMKEKGLKAETPSLRNLILSGHSAGGKPLVTIANMAHRYDGNVREVWCFDGWYWHDTAEKWWTFLEQHRTTPLYGYYTKGSLGNTAGPQIAKLLGTKLKDLLKLVKPDPKKLPTTVVYRDGTPANGTLECDPGEHGTEPARLIGGLVKRSVNLHNSSG